MSWKKLCGITLHVTMLIWPFIAPTVESQLIVQAFMMCVTYITIWTDDWDRPTAGETIVATGVGTVIFSIPYLLFSVVMGLIYPQVWATPEVQRQEIVIHQEAIHSLSGEVGVAGSFALGYGTVDNTPFYAAYRRNKDGSYELLYIRGRSLLYETAGSSQTPHYKKYKVQTREVRRTDMPRWVRYTMKVHQFTPWEDTGEQFQRIYVPPNTVRREFRG